jgi:hypothetical protein
MGSLSIDHVNRLEWNGITDGLFVKRQMNLFEFKRATAKITSCCSSWADASYLTYR